MLAGPTPPESRPPHLHARVRAERDLRLERGGRRIARTVGFGPADVSSGRARILAPRMPAAEPSRPVVVTLPPGSAAVVQSSRRPVHSCLDGSRRT